MHGLRRAAPALLLLALASAWAARAQGSSAPATESRREVRIGVPGVPSTLDPATALEGAVPLVARQVFDTLVAYRQGSTDIEPALATRWNVSRDGLVWSFALREGVKFHDGSRLTATDVAASFARQLRGEVPGSPVVWSAVFRGVPGVVREVRAADSHTVQFVLVQPYAPLLTVLAHPGLGVVKSVTGSDGAARLIGTGPYRVVDASEGRLALEAVPDYWAGPPRPTSTRGRWMSGSRPARRGGPWARSRFRGSASAISRFRPRRSRSPARGSDRRSPRRSIPPSSASRSAGWRYRCSRSCPRASGPAARARRCSAPARRRCGPSSRSAAGGRPARHRCCSCRRSRRC